MTNGLKLLEVNKILSEVEHFGENTFLEVLSI